MTAGLSLPDGSSTLTPEPLASSRLGLKSAVLAGAPEGRFSQRLNWTLLAFGPHSKDG